MAEQLRAALYACVSSEEQVEGYSLDAQARAFRSLMEGRGWTCYKEYMEEGLAVFRLDSQLAFYFELPW